MGDYAPFLTDSTVNSLILPGTTADSSITGSLEQGFRSIEIGVYDNFGTFEILHSQQPDGTSGNTITLSEFLTGVVTFLTETGDKEIVVLDFQTFVAAQG